MTSTPLVRRAAAAMLLLLPLAACTDKDAAPADARPQQNVPSNLGPRAQQAMQQGNGAKPQAQPGNALAAPGGPRAGQGGPNAKNPAPNMKSAAASLDALKSITTRADKLKQSLAAAQQKAAALPDDAKKAATEKLEVVVKDVAKIDEKLGGAKSVGPRVADKIVADVQPLLMHAETALAGVEPTIK